MKIRTRISIWYAGLLAASLVLLSSILYYELIIERQSETVSAQIEETIEHQIAEVVLYYGAPTVFILLGAGWYVIKRALNPLDAFTMAVERIHATSMHERLPRNDQGDELDRLAEMFNHTLARLENSYKQIRGFTMNASHELKTPLAVLHVQLETLLSSPDVTVDHREAIASQLDEVQRLTRIVEGLTTLAKADVGLFPLNLEPVNLDELVRDCYGDMLILSQSKNISSELKRCDPTIIHGDRHRLRQLLLNLSDNAIKYTEIKGSIIVCLRQLDGYAELSMTNSGPGIEPNQLPNVFDRFYRGKSSTKNEAEGCGLGLSIVQWIVEAHHGTIDLISEPNAYTTATVKLPFGPKETL